MKRLVGLGLCLSLSLFSVARAMKPTQTLAVVAKDTQQAATGQKPDDSMEDASDDEEGDMSDDDASGDNDTNDDSGDDDGSDEGGGDDGGDDGGD